MEDRQSENPGRVKITLDDGTILNGVLERNDSPTVVGTPLNKATLFDSRASERYGAETPSEAFSQMATENEVAVPVSGWNADVNSDGWYTNQVTVEWMKEVYNPIMDLVVSGAELSVVESTAYNAVQEVETFDGYVIFKGNRVPTDDFTVRFRGV